ncbi:hypothetical protein [Sphingosinicella terrae]|uniref:hypothetical protein n=1 Tax=Sphingosinicella terrae TaxID=2172047 RepID=UPI000E0D4029|nr:hypothetical protein [Sphingosinicella terrae]
MSRDQRPGKLKVVGAAAPVHIRRKGDRQPQQGRIVAVAAPADAPTEAGSAQGPVMALLFLLAAAGSGAIFMLVGRLA